MKKVNIDRPKKSNYNDLARLIFEALEKSTYGGTKTGKPASGDHKEE